jgi:spore germination protein YaaH
MYMNWRGAYDLKTIGENVDFVSIMTYDQHGGRTTPGPVAGMPWVQDLLSFCLTQIPKQKISLGIPLYGRRWYTGVSDPNTASVSVVSINTADALALASSMKAQPQWDSTEHAPWFYFYRDGRREYVFYNDSRSFRDLYQLAAQKGLHGFSAWVIGAEDPQIWDALPARSAARR